MHYANKAVGEINIPMKLRDDPIVNRNYKERERGGRTMPYPHVEGVRFFGRYGPTSRSYGACVYV